MSESLTQNDRKTLTAELRVQHEATFKALGIPNAKFIPKVAHLVPKLSGKHMGFFHSELNHGQDVYIELVDLNYDPTEVDRNLYRFRWNPHFETELECSDEIPEKRSRWFVPLDELEEVIVPVKRGRGRPKKANITPTDIHVAEPTREPVRAIRTIIDTERQEPVKRVVESLISEDLPIDQLTILDLAAMLTRTACSNKEWLNKAVTNK